MQGKQNIIDGLNKLLTKELSSADMYFLHSRVYEDWGMTKIAQRMDGEKNHEGLHADMVMKRIIFLEGTPDVQSRDTFKVELNLRAMLEQALDYEMKNLADLKSLIALCEKEHDYETRNMLLTLLKDTEEDHIDWLETQLSLLDKIGEHNYIQSQM